MIELVVLEPCNIGSYHYEKGAIISMRETMEIIYLEVEGFIKIKRENDLFGGKL